MTMDASRNSARNLRSPPSEASPGRRLAREAVAWMGTHLTEMLTIGELCRALEARERTLHAAFCEHIGTSPKAYFKELRLAAARRELLHADQGIRVTDVALRWGFLHFGWFAHDYRQKFGEPPSATLRRAAGREPPPPTESGDAGPTRPTAQAWSASPSPG
jgi:transcriptional regulator GlxA family with amidase domain